MCKSSSEEYSSGTGITSYEDYIQGREIPGWYFSDRNKIRTPIITRSLKANTDPIPVDQTQVNITFPNEFISKSWHTLGPRYLLCIHHWHGCQGGERAVSSFLWKVRGYWTSSRGMYQQFNTTHLKSLVSKSYKVKHMETNFPPLNLPTSFQHLCDWNTLCCTKWEPRRHWVHLLCKCLFSPRNLSWFVFS